MDNLHKSIQDLFRDFKELEQQQLFLENEKEKIEDRGTLFGVGQDSNEELEYFNQVEEELASIRLKIRRVDEEKGERLNQILDIAIELLGHNGHPDESVIVSYQGNSFKITIEEAVDGIKQMNIKPI